MSRFETILFDLDGTLIDSTELILSSFRHVRQRFFGDVLPDADYVRGFGMPLRVALGAMARSVDEAEALFEAYVAYNLAHHDRMVTAFPGIRETLAQLCARGTKLAIVTGKLHQHARRGLEVSGLAEFFEVLVAGDDVERGKPHPDPVLRALEKCGARADRTLFVGDSSHDIAAGAAAGVATAAVGWGPLPSKELQLARPTYLIEAPSELLTLVEGSA